MPSRASQRVSLFMRGERRSAAQIAHRARHAKREGGLAQLHRHQPEHVLGGAQHHRDDDDGKRQATGNAREVARRAHHQLVDEQADDDRRGAEQDVVDEAHDGGKPGVLAVFGQVGSGEHAERGSQDHADDGHDQAADDRVQQAAG